MLPPDRTRGKYFELPHKICRCSVDATDGDDSAIRAIACGLDPVDAFKSFLKKRR
jgi:hypothetical protein